MSELNIYQRLSAVMKEVSYVQKEDKKVNNQYTFVSHDAVTAKVRPSLIEHGIVMITDVKEVRQDGNRTEAHVLLRFVNIDKPDDHIDVMCFGYGIDTQDKGPGKAVSYAVKYGILKTLCLEAGDDPEHDLIPHEPKTAGTIKVQTKTSDIPELKGADIDDVKLAMRECDELDALQAVFGSAFKKASKDQKIDLKTAYDKLKEELMAKETV